MECWCLHLFVFLCICVRGVLWYITKLKRKGLAVHYGWGIRSRLLQRRSIFLAVASALDYILGLRLVSWISFSFPRVSKQAAKIRVFAKTCFCFVYRGKTLFFNNSLRRQHTGYMIINHRHTLLGAWYTHLRRKNVIHEIISVYLHEMAFPTLALLTVGKFVMLTLVLLDARYSSPVNPTFPCYSNCNPYSPLSPWQRPYLTFCSYLYENETHERVIYISSKYESLYNSHYAAYFVR